MGGMGCQHCHETPCECKPWHFDWHVEYIDMGDGGFEVERIVDQSGDDVVVAECGVYPPDAQTAEFIAAAPDMYRALLKLLETNESTSLDGDRARDKARDALRKARGEAK